MILYLLVSQILCKKYIQMSDRQLHHVSSDDIIVIGNITYSLTDTVIQGSDNAFEENVHINISGYLRYDNPEWNLDRIDQRNNDLNTKYYSQDLAGEGVWNYVLDTGIWTRHSEFEGRAIWGANFIDEEDEDGCMHFHGTFVAGIIGGKTYGVAKKTTMVSVKVMGCPGWGSLWSLLKGIEWVTQQDKKKKVINMSLLAAHSHAINSAVEQAMSMGIVTVVAAGNDNDDACKFSPSGVADAITVGSTDADMTISGFSSWGPCVDIFAPGRRVRSAVPGGDTAVASGTSLSTPHVAGVVSLILDAYMSDMKDITDVRRVNDFLKRVSSKDKVLGDLKNAPNYFLFSIPSFA